METIHNLKAADIPKALRVALNSISKSRKRSVVFAERHTIPFDAGLWCDGSRENYKLVRLSDGATISDPMQHVSPWSASRSERCVDLAPDVALVRHTIFIGRDCGVTLFVHPSNAAALLAPEVKS